MLTAASARCFVIAAYVCICMFVCMSVCVHVVEVFKCGFPLGGILCLENLDQNRETVRAANLRKAGELPDVCSLASLTAPPEQVVQLRPRTAREIGVTYHRRAGEGGRKHERRCEAPLNAALSFRRPKRRLLPRRGWAPWCCHRWPSTQGDVSSVAYFTVSGGMKRVGSDKSPP